MLYSSGTTGHPKGIRRPLTGQPFGSDVVLSGMLGGIMGFAPGDVYLSPAPLYHSAPLVWSMTAQRLGGTVVVMEHFDPERLPGADRTAQGHARPVRPDHVRAHAQAARGGAGRYDLSSLRSVVHAAAPCPPEVKRRMIEWWGPVIHEYYSGTEGMGMTWITAAEALTHPGSVGQAIWGEVHVCGDDGEDLPAGDDGVVYFAGRRCHHLPVQPRPREDAPDLQRQGLGHAVGRRSPRRGGVPLPDRPQAVHDRVGWGEHLPPGDRGRPRAAPRRGRRGRLRHPGSRNGGGGQGGRPAGSRSLPGPSLAAEIIAFCRANLSHYKCPRTVDFTDLLPRGENGKLYKKAMREAYWASSSPSAG